MTSILGIFFARFSIYRRTGLKAYPILKAACDLSIAYWAMVGIYKYATIRYYENTHLLKTELVLDCEP